MILVVVCLVFAVDRLSMESLDDTPEASFLAMHAAEILVIFGIITTLIWLPWEEYNHANEDSAISKEDLELY